MKPERPKIDWPAAYVRLERSRRALEVGGQLPPEEAQRILDERAKALARPREEVSLPTVALNLLVFSLGAERYGIETTCVIDVLRFTELTRVPCTPPLVLGVVNHRGRIVPVLDLQRVFGGAGSGASAESRVVTVEAGGMTFGILAAAVTGSIRIGADDLAPPPAAPVGSGSSPVRGVTADMVAVLDVDALVRDSRMVVNEEVR